MTCGSGWGSPDLLDVPAGFFVTSLAFALYVLAHGRWARGVRPCGLPRSRSSPATGRGRRAPDVRHEFIRNAYLAGTFIALACGVIGWFVVLRGQVFAGDALSHVAFVGAIAAAAAGVDARVGLFALTGWSAP